MKQQQITLEINDKELVFLPNTTAYNSLVNEMTPSKKIAPAVNYLQRIVSADSKTALNEVLENNPGAAMHIVNAINEEYAPEIEIKVKK